MKRVDMRRALQNNDPTSTGGILIGTSDSTNHGTRLALEGDYATCPECKEGGPVFNDCKPLMSFMGKQLLVEGARVYCKCAKKPFVMATQSTMTVQVNWGGSEATARAEEDSAGALSDHSEGEQIPEHFDEMVMATCPSGPVVGYPYFVETSDGRGLFGHTDEHGQLPRIATMVAGSLTIYWGDEALVKHLGGDDA